MAQVGFAIDVPVAELETAGRKDLVQIFGSSLGVASLLPLNCSPRPEAFGCSR